MPRKPFDLRILLLAQHCKTDVQAKPALAVRPEAEPFFERKPEDPWDWCDVTVSVEYADQHAESIRTGLVYARQDDFLGSAEYQEMYTEALGRLLAKLDKAADAVVGLGPRKAKTGAP